jgi:cell division protein FtsL
MKPMVHADTANRRGIGVEAFLLALVTAGAMAHVGVRMKGIEVAYDLGRENRINTQLEEERRRLNIEIGMLKDPVRVVSIARDKLQMGPPAPTDIVRLAPGQPLRLPGDESAASARRMERQAGGATRSAGAKHGGKTARVAGAAAAGAGTASAPAAGAGAAAAGAGTASAAAAAEARGPAAAGDDSEPTASSGREADE